MVAELEGLWAEPQSQLQLGCFPALLSPGCALRVTVANTTSTDSHKASATGIRCQ